MAERKVRVGQKREADVLAGKAKTRSPEDVLKTYTGKNMDVIQKAVTASQIKKLIDIGVVEDAEQKRLVKRVKAIKEILLANAVDKNWATMAAEKGTASADPTSVSELKTIKQIIVALKDEGKLTQLDDFLGPRVGPMRKLLGDGFVDEITTKTTKLPKSKMTLKGF